MSVRLFLLVNKYICIICYILFHMHDILWYLLTFSVWFTLLSRYSPGTYTKVLKAMNLFFPCKKSREDIIAPFHYNDLISPALLNMIDVSSARVWCHFYHNSVWYESGSVSSPFCSIAQFFKITGPNKSLSLQLCSMP